MKKPSPFLACYSLLWRAVTPFLRRHKRLRDDFDQRLVPSEWSPGERVDIWIQAASGGEAYLAAQLINELARQTAASQQSRLRILGTSCTRQGLDVLGAAMKDAGERYPHLSVAIRVFPLDEPVTMRRALSLAEPGVVSLLETELWPGLMAACAEKKVPILVVNGRMTAKSLSGYGWLRGLWKRIAPPRVLAVSPEDAARFAALFGSERVGLMPNMKFDASAPAPVEADRIRLFDVPTKVVLLASVRQEEEPLLLPVIAYVRQHLPEATVVIAPRHMERIEAWSAALEARFGPDGFVRRSARCGTRPFSRRIVLWDAFGELVPLYARADAVFVGGSLVPVGGQNFLEPAILGLTPLVGPYWDNFAWVGREFFACGLGRIVTSAEDLGPALVDSLAGHSRDAARQRMEHYLATRRGGTRQAAQAVLATLDARE